MYEHHMKGSFLAQIIQSCLSLMQYPVKQIAIASIDLLDKLHALTTLQDHRLCDSSPQEDGPMPGYILWRNYYPGVFSSIFMLCCGKKGKVHSTVKVSAFCILLTITTSVIDDKIHFTLLQEFLQQQQHEATSSSNRLISSGAEFLKVLNIHPTALDAANSGNLEANGAGDESVYMKSNSDMNLPYVKADAPWRVDILQKMDKYFFMIHQNCVEVNHTINDDVKIDMMKKIFTLLVKAQVFLGPTRWKVFQLLAQRAHDSSLKVSTQAKKLICVLMGHKDDGRKASIEDAEGSSRSSGSSSSSSSISNHNDTDEDDLIDDESSSIRFKYGKKYNRNL